jgi:dihydropteroate synthase
MGIINVTPDSFSDGGLFLDAERAIDHGRRLAEEGAAVLDVGGESTRPGAQPVSAEVELERTQPVVRALCEPDGPGIPVSIDTSKAAVAAAALDAGGTIVNDVTALRADPELAGLCADRGCEVVLMHMLGEPRTMQERPVYEDVVGEVKAFLAERIEAAIAAGIAEDRISVDPGIGFGKTLSHNLELLRRLGELADLGRPLVIGTSRKSFIGALTGRDADDRVGGTVASNVLGLAAGADVFRVHDVRAVREAIHVAEAILGRRAWRDTLATSKRTTTTPPT